VPALEKQGLRAARPLRCNSWETVATAESRSWIGSVQQNYVSIRCAHVGVF